MSFLYTIMSFLLDIPILLPLFALIVVYISTRFTYKFTNGTKNSIIIFSILILVIFYLIAVPWFFNYDLLGISGIWQNVGTMIPGGHVSKTPRDFMINTGILNFDYALENTTMTVIGIFLFAMYPVVYYYSLLLGHFLFGWHEKQTGLIGLFQ